jgi:AcrR family transcriptional regulator
MNTKEKIFETALNLFAENGFEATSIRDITKATGLSVASFYNHFKSKNELLQAIYDFYSGLDHSDSAVKPDYEQLLDHKSPYELFDDLASQIIESLLNDKLVKLTRVIINEQYTNKTAGEIAFRDRQVLLTSMEELFAVMGKKGMLKVKEPAALGRLIGYMYLGFSMDNIYDIILGQADARTIVNNQLELIRSLLREIVVAG